MSQGMRFCVTSKSSDQPAHTHSLARAFACRLNILSVKLLTGHRSECLSLKGGCTGLSEFIHVKMPHCWKSRAAAEIEKINNFFGKIEAFFLPTNFNMFWVLKRTIALGRFF